MTKKNSKSLLDAVETIIGSSAFFEGNIKALQTLRIDGKLKGDIEASGVLVGAEAFIEGNIKTEVILVGGTVTGNIKATDYIEILPKAKVTGDIETNSLTIAEGAFFDGKSTMLKAEENNGAAKK
jgi:cytoskeletal protein CcmA (bactofilin family)